MTVYVISIAALNKIQRSKELAQQSESDETSMTASLLGPTC